MKKKIKKPPPMTPAMLRRATIIAIALCAVAIAAVTAKAAFLGVRLVPGAESPLWTLEVKLSVSGSDGEGVAILHVPAEEPGQAIIEERVLSLGHPHKFRDAGANRLLDLTVKPGETVKIFYRAALRVAPRSPRPSTGEAPQKFLKIRDRAAGEIETLGKIAAGLRGEPGTIEAARSVMAYIRESVTVESTQAGRSLSRLLKKGAGNPEDQLQLHVDLSRARGIPSRKVAGFLPLESGRAEPVAWVEHLIDGRWHMSAPDRNLFGEVKENAIVLYRGEAPVAYGRGLKKVGATFRISKDLYAQQEEVKAGVNGKLSLYRLPVETQKFVKLLLLVPLAALLVVFFRLVLRGETVGTFLPVILALSFRTTELAPGVLMLTVVMAIGIAALVLFRRIGLPRVPAAALMVTVIVVTLAYLSLAGEALELYRLEYIAFFPIVIMTLLVERISARFFDGGWREMAKIYFGTVLVASLSYLIITQPYLQNLFMRLPELLLLVMGLIIGVALLAQRRERATAGGELREE